MLVFRWAPFNEVIAAWIWIAIWVYVGMRIERRRAKSRPPEKPFRLDDTDDLPGSKF